MAGVILTKPSGAGGALAAEFADSTKEPTGFINRTDSTISFSSGSPQTRTFTIEPSGESGGSPPYYQYYIHGVKHTEYGTKTVTIPDVSGTYFLYIDEDGILQTSQTFPPGLLADYAYTAVVYWNATVQELVYFGEERHGITMDGATHLHLHLSLGTQYISGLTINGLNTLPGGSPATGSPFGSPNSSTDTDVQFSVSPGTIRDEDLGHSIVDIGMKTFSYDLEQELSPIAKIPIFYRIGSNIWRVKKNVGSPADVFPFIYSDGVVFTGAANGLPPYNMFGGSPEQWSLIEIANGSYFFIHYLATNDVNNPIIGIQGTTEYTSKPDGQTEAATEIAIFDGQIPFQEFTLISSVIYQASTSFSNTPKVRAVKTNTEDDYVDWRNLEVFASTTGGTGLHDHGNLGGLLDDDHPQYATNAYDSVTDGTTTVSAVKRDNILRFNSDNNIDINVSSGGGSPPATASVTFSSTASLEGLTDTNVHTTSPSPVDKDILQYSISTGLWENNQRYANRVIINSYDDLPTPSGSPLMHHMTPNINYFITGFGITTPYPFYCEGNSSMTGLWVFGGLQLIYTGTLPMFNQYPAIGGAIDGAFDMHRLIFACPNAEVLNLHNVSSPGAVCFIRLNQNVAYACAGIGSLTNYSLDWNGLAFGVTGISSGLVLSNQPNTAILSMRQISFNAIGDGVTAIDLQDSVFTTIEFRDVVFNLAPGATQATAISGLPDSGNLPVGRIATMDSCEFGTGGSPVDIIPLEGITTDDIRWKFNGNSNLEDTFPRALLTIKNNTTPSIISAPNTPVPVVGIWELKIGSQFTQGGSPSSNGSRLLYVGERQLQIIIDIALGIQTQSGQGTHDIRISIWKNGSPYFGSPDTGDGSLVIPGVGATNTARKNATILWLDTFVQGDYIELYIENLENDSNYIVTNGVIRLTSKS